MEPIRIGKDAGVRPLVNALAGARELTAPRSSALVRSLKASCNRVVIATYMKRSASKRKEAVAAGDRTHHLSQSPNPMRTPFFRFSIRIGRALRAFVRMFAVVVRSRDGVRFGPCPSIAKVPGEWKDRMHLASLALKGI